LEVPVAANRSNKLQTAADFATIGKFGGAMAQQKYLSRAGAILLGCLLAGSVTPAGLAQDPHLTTSASENSLPDRRTIKDCMNAVRGAECLDQLFRSALKEHSTSEALQSIERFSAEDPELRRDCHPVVHAIGRETYRIKGNIHDAFLACDQTCHSGCYHGSVERFLRGDDIYAQVDRHPSASELKQKAAVACDPGVPYRYRFQCLHGLGHALLFFSRYQLIQSLETCDALAEDWSRNSCYGGVFMENVFNATPETRDLSATDYHYPCNKVAKKYRSECYVMQTSRMTEMGLGTEAMFKECAKAGEFRDQCMLSIGRDLSNDVRFGNPLSSAQKCELANGDGRDACIRGAVYALIDNTWDGRYALPFCAALTQESDQAACFNASAQYLKTTFEKSSADVAQECAKYLNQPARCVELASN
jgi:hypothetical protein